MKKILEIIKSIFPVKDTHETPEEGKLRIVEIINVLNEKSYTIQEYRYRKAYGGWFFPLITNIDTYENAKLKKFNLEQQKLRNTIVYSKPIEDN